MTRATLLLLGQQEQNLQKKIVFESHKLIELVSGEISYKGKEIHFFETSAINYFVEECILLVESAAGSFPFKTVGDIVLAEVQPYFFKYPAHLNEVVQNPATDHCLVRLFSGKTAEYLGSACGIWSELPQEIEKALKSKQLPTEIVQVGLTSNSMLELADHFGLAPKWCISYLFVESHGEVSLSLLGRQYSPYNLPNVPKRLLLGAANALLKKRGLAGEAKALLRRLIVISMNRGVPVHLLDEIVAACSEFPSSSSFQQVALNLTDLEEFGDTAQVLAGEMESFRRNVSSASSEATFNNGFWLSLLKTLVQTRPSQCDMNCHWEYFLGHYLPGLNKYIDWVACFYFAEKWIPILFVESSRDPLLRGVHHKDSTKLLSTVSAACSELAELMIDVGRDASEARVYGLFISGPYAHMVVAHAVVGDRSVAESAIQVHVSMHPHWRLDMLADLPAEKVDCPHCRTDDPSKRSQIIPASIQPTPESLLMKPMKLALEPDLGELAGDLELEMQSEVQGEVEEEEDLACPPEQKRMKMLFDPETPFLDHFSRQNPRMQSLKRLRAFVEAVKQSADAICSAGLNPLARDWQRPESSEYPVPSGRKTTEETPTGNRIGVRSKSLAEESRRSKTIRSDDRNLIILTKYKTPEAGLVKRLAVNHPTLFPRLFGFEFKEATDESIFFYEKLLPLMECGAPNTWFKLDQTEDRLIGMIRVMEFTLDCATCLHVLHTKFEYVHADISPNNIMYSKVDSCWKLIDYDRSRAIEESLRTPRTSGTQFFNAPEVISSKIFTPEADVFALGMVIQRKLMNRFCMLVFGYNPAPELPKELLEVAKSFQFMVISMLSFDPSLRPTPLEIMDKIIGTFRIIDDKSLWYKKNVATSRNLLEEATEHFGIKRSEHIFKKESKTAVKEPQESIDTENVENKRNIPQDIKSVEAKEIDLKIGEQE